MVMMPPPGPGAPPSQGSSPSAYQQPSAPSAPMQGQQGLPSADPRSQLISVAEQLSQVISAVDRNFPGGEADFHNAFAQWVNMKLQALGQPEPAGPPVPA